MKFSTWNSSVFRNKSYQLRKINNQKANRSSILRNIHERMNAEDILKHSSFEGMNSLYRDGARREDSLNLSCFEGLEDNERAYGVIETPCLENYLRESPKNQYVVHTFARPNGLVVVKNKIIRKAEVRPVPLSPTIRIGMAGCRLIKPRIINTTFDFKRALKCRNRFLEVVSKKLL